MDRLCLMPYPQVMIQKTRLCGQLIFLFGILLGSGQFMSSGGAYEGTNQTKTLKRQFIPTPTMDWEWKFTHSSGQYLQLNLQVNPKGAFSKYMVELPLPNGVEVVTKSLSHGGIVEGDTIHWGIFEDNKVRNFLAIIHDPSGLWDMTLNAKGVFNDNIDVQYQGIPTAQDLFIYPFQEEEPETVNIILLATPNIPMSPHQLEKSYDLMAWENSLQIFPNHPVNIQTNLQIKQFIRLKRNTP